MLSVDLRNYRREEIVKPIKNKVYGFICNEWGICDHDFRDKEDCPHSPGHALTGNCTLTGCHGWNDVKCEEYQGD